MAEIVVFLVIAAFLLGLVVWLLGRIGRGTREAAGRPAVGEPVRPRPSLAEFHVHGDEARVYFDVPLAKGEVDAVLSDLLLSEAVEVVREKRHSLPITDVGRVVAYGKLDGEWHRVGQLALEEPGVLPPPLAPAPAPHLGKLAYDPLERQFAGDLPSRPPPVVEEAPKEDLPPVGRELRIPAAVETALRAQGVEPQQMSAGQLVTGLLGMLGYTLMPAEKEETYFATKGGIRTYLRVVPHQPSEYTELDERVVNEFFVDFASAGADRGLLVSDKFAPFIIHTRERREPRVRFVTRERLQNFVDALALS